MRENLLQSWNKGKFRAEEVLWPHLLSCLFCPYCPSLKPIATTKRSFHSLLPHLRQFSVANNGSERRQRSVHRTSATTTRDVPQSQHSALVRSSIEGLMHSWCSAVEGANERSLPRLELAAAEKFEEEKSEILRENLLHRYIMLLLSSHLLLA